MPATSTIVAGFAILAYARIHSPTLAFARIRSHFIPSYSGELPNRSFIAISLCSEGIAFPHLASQNNF